MSVMLKVQLVVVIVTPFATNALTSSLTSTTPSKNRHATVMALEIGPLVFPIGSWKDRHARVVLVIFKASMIFSKKTCPRFALAVVNEVQTRHVPGCPSSICNASNISKKVQSLIFACVQASIGLIVCALIKLYYIDSTDAQNRHGGCFRFSALKLARVNCIR